jgi:polar amino acid transport system substrate-binding protein
MNASPELCTALAPTGVLRAAINLGNPLLAARDDAGAVHGVSVDLALALATQLGVELALRVFDTAAQSVQAVADEAADIGFFAIDPARGASIGFTAPYLLIEGCYLVRADSPLQQPAEVDAPGHTVVVGQGSAYDLFLSRTLKAATVLRAASSQAVVATFVDSGASVAAGLKQPLQAEAAARGGLRLLEGAFMLIQQAMGLPKSRGEAAAAHLAGFVEAMKAEGFVAAAMARHGVSGASVAPPADPAAQVPQKVR